MKAINIFTKIILAIAGSYLSVVTFIAAKQEPFLYIVSLGFACIAIIAAFTDIER